MQLRDRIKELRRVPASQLRPNPKNWRTHPDAQQNAVRGVLAEIGIANAVLARELPDGSLMLIDGHLRAETLGAETVPVLVLDVDEAEADKLLVTLDPLAAMAETNNERLTELLQEIETSSEAVQEMLDNLWLAENGIEPSISGSSENQKEVAIKSGWEIIVTCRDESHQKELFQALTSEGVECRLLTF